MKKYNLLYILTAGMMLFSSCEDFLNTDSPSEQSKENLFENEGMTRSAIMGVYSELAGTYVRVSVSPIPRSDSILNR